jgi:hypothetical protein
MSLTELRPAIHLLPRPEKLLLVQELLAELDQQDELARLGIFPHKQYPIWSPTENYDAAEVLQKLLREKSGGGSLEAIELMSGKG